MTSNTASPAPHQDDLSHAEYLRQVRAQYEELPYPPRNPEEERVRLGATYSDNLDQINHHCFGGRQDFNQGFRVLVAGGGTGDCSVFMGEQLRGLDAEIVHLDMSNASIEVAKQRAAVRKLDNITFVHESLLELPNRKDLGTFDYINCSGVLHHLSNPEAGLKALASVLKENGVMSIMVYAEIGRTAVYQMQELMRLINEGEEDMRVWLKNTRSVLEALPPTNWWKRTENLIGDVKRYGDSGLLDLFLHQQDRAYNVLQLYDFVGSADLHIKKMVERPGGNLAFDYNPEVHLKAGKALEQVKKLDLKEQQYFSELMYGAITKHSFFAGFTPYEPPRTDDMEMIPFISGHVHQDNIYTVLYNASRVETGKTFELKNPVYRFNIEVRPHTSNLLKHINGKRTIGQIFDKVRDEVRNRNSKGKSAMPVPSVEELQQDFDSLFHALHDRPDWLLLRHKSVPPFLSIRQLQQRFEQQYRDA